MIVLVGETSAASDIQEYIISNSSNNLRILTKENKLILSTPEGRVLREGNFSDCAIWLEELDCRVLVNASHPSTAQKLSYLQAFCEQANIAYASLMRPETKISPSPYIYEAGEMEQAIRVLEDRVQVQRSKGRRATIFVTTGSHQLEILTASSLMKSARLVVRVLPEGRLVQKCQDLRIPPRDIAALQGPFTKEINRALFKFYGANILLTRDSGAAGGTDTKLSAALALEMDIVLIRRNYSANETGFRTVKEVKSWLQAYL